MLAALANIFRITELRQKVIFTLAMFIVFRAGTHIPVPGVNASVIEQLFRSGNLFGLLDMFSGGALSKFSIFAMSITPYINASIILQLLKVVVPTLEQWSKEGEEGYKKTTKLTQRMVTGNLNRRINACKYALPSMFYHRLFSMKEMFGITDCSTQSLSNTLMSKTYTQNRNFCQKFSDHIHTDSSFFWIFGAW